jgi:predicted GIY-YIG superfamily endonuclease
MNIAGRQLLLFPPTRPLAERFGADFFRAIPDRPGVYFMSTARDGVLYVGKAKNLRRRLGSYRSGTGERLPRRLLRLVLTVERIDWDICSDEATALVRERDLIRALQPRFNSLGLRPPKEWFIGWRRQGDDLTVSLAESPADSAESRGPFVYARPAFVALLRSLWLRLHPGSSIAELPCRLLNGSGPARLTVRWSKPAYDWLKDLETFLDGRESPLLPTALPPAACPPDAPSPSPDPARAPTFDEQWQSMDRECLAEFYERILARETTGLEAGDWD